MHCSCGDVLEKGAEFACFFRHLRGKVVLLARVGAQVIELLAAAQSVGAPALVVAPVTVFSAAAPTRAAAAGFSERRFFVWNAVPAG